MVYLQQRFARATVNATSLTKQWMHAPCSAQGFQRWRFLQKCIGLDGNEWIITPWLALSTTMVPRIAFIFRGKWEKMAHIWRRIRIYEAWLHPLHERSADRCILLLHDSDGGGDGLNSLTVSRYERSLSWYLRYTVIRKPSCTSRNIGGFLKPCFRGCGASHVRYHRLCMSSDCTTSNWSATELYSNVV